MEASIAKTTSRRAARALRTADQAPKTPPDGFYSIHQGDARRLDIILSPYSSLDRPLLTTTITSPPYGALKDYGHPEQIGYRQRPDEYLVDMRRVFGSIYRHTRADGSMWVVADTLRRKSDDSDMWKMQLLPFDLAREAELEGWVLRDVVMWVKDKTLPWSSRGRMRNGFEYVLFFVKSNRFKYHVDRLRQPDDLKEWWVRYPERYNPQGKAPSNVWAVPIPVQGSWSNTAIQHACPLPPDLVERMLLLSSDEGDVVLDPFAGSGVVVAEAQRLHRRGLGVELVDRHIDAFTTTVLPEITERRGVDELQVLREQSDTLQRTITDLRTVKYPKTLLRQARKIDSTLPRPVAVYALRRPKASPDGRIAVGIVAVLEDEELHLRDDYLDVLTQAARRRPASKFGVAEAFEVVPRSSASRLHRGRRLWAYIGGNTYQVAGRCSMANLDQLAAAPSRNDLPLIVSNVRVDEKPRRLRAGLNGC